MRGVGRAKRLRAMEWSRRIMPTPVGDTIGAIRALLHLPDEEAGHERMKAAGRNVEHIAATRRMSGEEWGDVSASGQGTRNVGGGDGWSTPEQQLSVGRGLKDQPRLMLADRISAVHHLGEGIIGVHLHRKPILHVEQLHQNTAWLLVGIAEPGLADWATRSCVGGKRAKTITTPHARNETRGYQPS